MNGPEKQLHFDFTYLPEYAGFILDNKFREYVELYVNTSNELAIPLLRHFEGIPKEQTDKIAAEQSRRFLTALKNKNYQNFIDEGIKIWTDDQLPVVSRDQVAVGDIGLISYARRQTLRNIVPCFTKDIHIALELCSELDFFLTSNEAALYTTLMGIQQEKLSVTNEALSQRENQLLEAQRIAQIGSFEWDLTGNGRSTFTPEVYNIFSFSKSNGLDNFLTDVHPDDRQKLQDAINDAMVSGNYQCEYRYIRNNNLKYILSRGVVHYENGKPVRITGTVADNSEKSILIEKLRESEELNKQAQALTNTGNWKWTIANEQIEWSDEMYRIYGLAPQSEKISFERFLSFIHPDDRERRIQEISSAIQTGIAGDYNMKIINPDGTEKVLRGKGKVLFDKNGIALGMVGTCQDITMEYGLSVELLRKNDELMEKNKELESFNFIASHDLQEPLRKIQLYSSRLKTENDEFLPKTIADNLRRITKAAESLQKMIKDFLHFSQYLHEEEKETLTDLNQIIQQIIREYDNEITDSGMVIDVFPLPKILARREHIYQAFRNIISNAIKFQHHDKNAVLKIYSEVFENSGSTYYKICFTDNGIGFDRKYKDRIFELFQRLHSKEEYPGSGIGLSLCKKIIENHSGFIEVDAETGKGAAFNVFLPLQNSDTPKEFA